MSIMKKPPCQASKVVMTLYQYCLKRSLTEPLVNPAFLKQTLFMEIECFSNNSHTSSLPKKPSLPTDYPVKHDLFAVSTGDTLKTDSTWLLGRMDITSISKGNITTENKSQRMPSLSLILFFLKKI